MVLLNGIKYACERCIRGHRVSACTHTDKTLVMIKPKGRPASQCTHCREQRKIKNAHTLCHCGKKGKLPGQHLASCLCHKNSHCTCVTKEKKTLRKPVSPDVAALDSGDASVSEASQSRSEPPRPAPVPASAHDLDFLIEDIALPFETNQGLLDYFSGSLLHQSTPTPGAPLMPHSHADSIQPVPIQAKPGGLAGAGPGMMPHANQHQSFAAATHNASRDLPGEFSSAPGPPRDAAYFPHPPSDTDLDLMENMFPLFPLVGFNSFEHDKSLPLLGLPEEAHRSPPRNESYRMGAAPYPLSISSFKTDGPQAALSRNRSGSTQPPGTPQHSGLQSAHPSSVSLSNTTPTATHHPRPLKPSSSSFSVGYQSSRPKRSESVMSAASTSSNTSKQNLFDASQASQHNFSKAQSAAYPPFNLENNSTDDFHSTAFASPGLFNENRSLPILSDEEAPRSWQHSGNVTPQSSMPSRQVLQTRRKASLSRSHLQLHHHGVAKEHSLYQVRAGSSVENSPRQLFEKKATSYDGGTQKMPELDSFLREVTEESAGFPQRDAAVQPTIFTLNNDDFNIENPDFSLIPMYQELFDATQPMHNGL